MSAASPLHGNTHLISMAILVDGKEIKNTYQVFNVEVDHCVNKISKAKIHILDGDPSIERFEISESEDFIPGKILEIKAGYNFKYESLFKGIIVRHRAKIRGSKGSELIIQCSDEATKLSVARRNRYYEKSRDSDVISEILNSNGIESNVTNTTIKHDKIVQSYATDWDFIISRAEVNGMIVLTDAGKLTICQPDFSQQPALVIRYGESIVDLDVELDIRHQIESVNCNAWDYKKQEILTENSVEPSVNEQGNLDGKKLAGILGIKDYTLQSTIPMSRNSLKEWANAELLKSRMSKIRGKVSFSGNSKVKPNTIIELAGVSSRFNGNAFVSSVKHSIEGGDWVTTVTMGMSPQWFAEENRNIIAPEAAGVIPGIEGLQNGKVKKIEADPSGETRMLVDIPILKSSGMGIWARMASFYATNTAGAFFIPEIGDEVILGFLNNDPRFPIILGMMYNSHDKKPPYTPDKKNTTKAIVTKSQLKLEFNDDKKIITIETPKGNTIILDDENSKITLKDNNSNTVVLSSSGISMDTPKNISLKAKGNIKLDALQDITLSAKKNISVDGLNISNSAKVNYSAEGKVRSEVKSTGQTVVRGTIVMIN